MSTPHVTRRAFTAIAMSTLAFGCASPRKPEHTSDVGFRISLAQWSLHRAIFGGEFDTLEFPRLASQRYGIDAVELVNQFFMERAHDPGYLRELKQRADDSGVEILLIMCDGVGRLGDPDDAKRSAAVEGHVPWLEAASALGCHSIRVNAASSGGYEEQQRLAADGLRRLATLAEDYALNVIVENHGGLSSNGAWLAGVLERVGLDNCGSLPDFGNFCMNWNLSHQPDAWYDRYQGVRELMPFAKAVSAKSHAFDDDGNETSTDYLKMMRIVRDSGYRGYIGIEYEGSQISEHDGIVATKRLLERAFAQL